MIGEKAENEKRTLIQICVNHIKDMATMCQDQNSLHQLYLNTR